MSNERVFIMYKIGERVKYKDRDRPGFESSIGGLPRASEGPFKVLDLKGQDITKWVKLRQGLGPKNVEQVIKVLNFLDRVKGAKRLLGDTTKLLPDDNSVKELNDAWLTFLKQAEKYSGAWNYIRANKLKKGQTKV